MEANKENNDLLTNKCKSLEMAGIKCGPTVQVCVNFVIIFMVGIPVLLFALLAEPRERGFYCNDDSLQYPLVPSSISTTALIIGGISIPVVFMLIVESLMDLPVNYESVFVCKRRIPSRVAAICSTLGYFAFGCACIQVITDVTKYNVGRLRPHFHAACQTDWNTVTCSQDGHSMYVTNFTCTSTDLHTIRDARLSFFSGHASFSAFTMIYLIMYLERRIIWTQPVLIKPLIQLACLLASVFTCVSRVFDYHHHWSDVLFGFIVGTIMAILISLYVSRLMPNKRKNEQDIEMSLNS